MKRTWFAFFLCLIFSHPGQTKWHDGWRGNWLIGLSGILIENKAHLDIGLGYTALPPFIPATYLDLKQTDRHHQWEALGGYQLQKNGWILGTELNLRWRNDPENSLYAFSDPVGLLGWNVAVRYKETPSIGLTGRVGYEMASYFKPFIRLGVQSSRDQLEVNLTADPAILSLTMNLQDTQWQYHFVGGFGAEIPLYARLATRLEYNYLCAFKNPSMEVSSILIAAQLNPAVSAQTHPRSQMGKISLVWNFA